MSLDISGVVEKIRDYVRKLYEREGLIDEAVEMLINGPVNYCLRRAQELSSAPEEVRTHFVNCILDVAAVLTKTTEEVDTKFSQIISEREVKRALKIARSSIYL